MTDVSDLLEAFVAIAKDPKAWDTRVGVMQAAAGDLAEARQLKKDTDASAAQAAKDVETAHYERDQIERTRRDITGQALANAQRERELDKREAEIKDQMTELTQWKANALANISAREDELTKREAAAAKQLQEAQALMANYDEAKHQAALKLAS